MTITIEDITKSAERIREEVGQDDMIALREAHTVLQSAVWFIDRQIDAICTGDNEHESAYELVSEYLPGEFGDSWRKESVVPAQSVTVVLEASRIVLTEYAIESAKERVQRLIPLLKLPEPGAQSQTPEREIQGIGV